MDVKIAKCSVTIKAMLEGLGMDDEEVVPLPNVNSPTLKEVIQWATVHKDDILLSEDDENKENHTDDICSWDDDRDFLKVDQGTLFELILAANYLEITGLLDVTCKTVANMITGKTPEDICKTFNIKHSKVCKENEWCEDKKGESVDDCLSCHSHL